MLTREWDKIVELFTDDAVAILHRRGRFEGKGRDGHLALQPSIRVDGDTATANWLMYIMIMDPKGGYENKWIHGRHDMKYVRINGKWKIKHMLFTSPWSREEWSQPTLEQLASWEK